MILLANLTVAFLMQALPRRSPVPQNATVRGGANTDAVATFTGVFKSADRKFITIGVESGETMRMYITGSTKFFRDGKPAHAKDFQVDENVTVDAARDARLNLLAVRVEAVPPPKPPPAPPNK